MRTLFVVLPFVIKDYLKVASKLAFAASMKLGEYLKLLPDANGGYGFGLYFELHMKGTDANTHLWQIQQAIGLMNKADYLLFMPGWEKYKECTILHKIAETYGLNILELDGEQDVELRDCPFCGVAPLPNVLKDPDDEGGLYYVRCEICGAQGARGRDEREAMKLWDKREGS